MRSPRLLATAAAAVLLSLNLPGGAAPPPSAAPPGPVVQAAPAATRWITLVTGDKVMVRTAPGKPEQFTFTPGRGTGSRGAVTSQVGGHTTIIPVQAMRDVASGRLDRSLFDVTTLLAERYDDSSSKVMPLIVSYAGSPAAARTRAQQDTPTGATRTRLLTSIGSRAVAVTKAAGAAFWRSVSAGGRIDPTVARIQLDHRVQASTDQSVPQIGAPAAWQRGFTGRGVKVAVLDTGIDAGHPDLAGKVAAAADFTDGGDPADHLGHGTHVADIIAGSGAASGGQYRGVAPDATLLNGKVLGDDGWGYSSGIIAGMEWAAAQGAKVVNLSLGGPPSDGTDALSRAVDTLSRQTGALFVVAAGNCDPYFGGPQQISAPASADTALAVANLERDGSTNPSSCQGPRAGDFALKPEIAAPGTDIVAAKAADTQIGTPVGEHYTTLTGTSMATPHVAGTAALVAQSQPAWTGDELRRRLISTSDPQGTEPVARAGAGRVDADQATDGSVTVDTGELELGYLKWPHTDQQPITKRLTYRNTGSTAVTLDLVARLDAGDTTPAPRLSAPQLVVPAGGQAAVDVVVDPALGSYGAHFGRVVATPAGAGDPLVTPLGWFYEDERVELNVRGIDRTGAAAESIVIIDRPDGKPLTGLSPDGTALVDGKATLRVPPGTLDLSTYIVEPSTDSTPVSVSLVAEPQVDARSDVTVTLDARKAVAANLTAAGRPDLIARYRLLRHYRTNVDGGPAGLNSAWITEPSARYFATPTDPVTVGDLEFRTGGRLEVPPFLARSLGAGGRALDVADVDWGPRLSGVHDLVAVDAGAGGPDELGDVRGKLAVIRHDRRTGSADDLLEAAQVAGASAVLLYNPDLPGLDGASEGLDGTGLTVPTLRTSRTGAAALLELMKARPVTVRITGAEWTPVVYDLLAPTRGRVPAAPDHVARPANLARIDERFGAHRTGMPMIEDRVGGSELEPPRIVSPIDVTPILPAPATRTAWVSADAGITWSQHVLPLADGFNGWFFTPNRSYPPGNRSGIDWFLPVANSGTQDGDGASSVQRVEGSIRACIDPIGRSGIYEALLDPPSSTLTVRRDGEVLGSIDSRCAFFSAPEEPADYELSLDSTLDTPAWRYSTRVRSTWSFHSTGAADEMMPLVLADLTVPSANLLNQVRTGKAVDLTLGLRHQTGATTPAFTSARLELSYDGTTWTTLPLRPTGKDRYTTKVTHPHTMAGKAPHLRLTVADAAGGRLTQEITRAYGLTR